MSKIISARVNNSFSFGEFTWWIGVVEDRYDPEKLGRLKVRIYVFHSDDKEMIPTDHLHWATVVQPITSSFFGGIGTSPTGIVEGTSVIGFFMDGPNAQVPVIFGTIGGKPFEKNKKKGFNDPNGIYSKYPNGEQDTSRLARNEKIDSTPVKWRKETKDKADKAFGGTFCEPETKYDAVYPYNHVRESEPLPKQDVSGEDPPKNCGHIEEIDDTPGAERLYRQHKIGTFEEIHPDGSRVGRIIAEQYVSVGKDDHLHVLGNGMVTIDGNSHVLIKGDAYIEIKGNCKEYVHQNYDLHVGGNYTVQVDGIHSDNANVHRIITSKRIDLN